MNSKIAILLKTTRKQKERRTRFLYTERRIQFNERREKISMGRQFRWGAAYYFRIGKLLVSAREKISHALTKRKFMKPYFKYYLILSILNIFIYNKIKYIYILIYKKYKNI